jgi:drug/metabolite transporter (DMT)-like permease
VVSNGTVTA